MAPPPARAQRPIGAKKVLAGPLPVKPLLPPTETPTLPAMATVRDTKAASDPKAAPKSAPPLTEAMLDQELAVGRLRPVYIVTSGDDPNADKKKVRERPQADPQALLAVAAKIEQAALLGGDRALDYVKIDYIDGDFAASGMHQLIANEVRSSSLFGGRRVVTVVHAEALAFGEAKGRGKKAKAVDPADLDPIEMLLAKLGYDEVNPAYVLIFVASIVSPGSRAWSTLASAGALVEVAPMLVHTLQTYLEQQGAPYKVAIHLQAGQKIWDRLGGSDAARLRSTADRLLLDAGPKGNVTLAMIEDTVPMDREAAVFAITDAINGQDLMRALTVLNLMLEHAGPSAREDESMKIMGYLASHYMLTAQVAALAAQGKHFTEIAQLLKAHEYRCQLMVQWVRNAKPGRLDTALRAIADADLMLKSSQLADRKTSGSRWLEQLITVLVRGQPLRRRTEQSMLAAL